MALATMGVTAVDNRLAVAYNEDLTEVEIETNVRSAFVSDSYLSGYEIDVSVEGGSAVLEGEVDTSFENSWASHVASGVSGVIQVDNNLSVDPVSFRPLVCESYTYGWPAYQFTDYQVYQIDEPVSDEGIKAAIESELFWSPFVDDEDIEVSVKSGVATMKGSVNSRFKMNTAIANGLEGGARYVKNRLDLVE